MIKFFGPLMLSPTLDLYYKIEKARSQGIDAYSLSNPIFDDESFNKLLIEPEANLLLPPIGLSPLRIKCSERLFQKWDCTSHETTICAGAKAALFSIFRLCAKNNNGKVIIINPSWPSYFDIVKVSGLSPVGFDTRFDENFTINVDRLGELFKKVNPVAVVLSNPNNPSGKIYDEEELKRICESCQYYGVALVIDESFSRIVFDEKKWFASRVSLDDSIFIVNSLSKNYNLQGFRVAPALIPRESIDQFLAIHQTIAASASSIAQHLSLQIMKQDKYEPSRESKFDESREIAL